MTNHDGRQALPPAVAARDVRQLSNRVLNLFELQLELLQEDIKESSNDCKRGTAVLVGGTLVGLSTIPILLLAVAEAFREWGGLSSVAAHFAAALIGLIVAAAAVFLGWRLLCRGLAVFHRSLTEYRTNYAWLKDVLSGQTPADRDRECVP